MPDKRCEELIASIKLLHDELRQLDVKPEHINFKVLKPEQLQTELDAVSRQVETRKRFLGVN